LDTRFTVGQSIAEESKVGLEPRLGQHGMMRRRIQRIVDRNTRPGPERLICADDGIAAAVGEYEIVLWNERPEWVLGILTDPIERRGRIDVPEDHRGSRSFE